VDFRIDMESDRYGFRHGAKVAYEIKILIILMKSEWKSFKNVAGKRQKKA